MVLYPLASPFQPFVAPSIPQSQGSGLTFSLPKPSCSWSPWDPLGQPPHSGVSFHIIETDLPNSSRSTAHQSAWWWGSGTPRNRNTHAPPSGALITSLSLYSRQNGTWVHVVVEKGIPRGSPIHNEGLSCLGQWEALWLAGSDVSRHEGFVLGTWSNHRSVAVAQPPDIVRIQFLRIFRRLLY